MRIKDYLVSLLMQKQQLEIDARKAKGFDKYPIESKISTIQMQLDQLAISCLKSSNLNQTLENTYSDEQKYNLTSILYRRVKSVYFTDITEPGKILSDEGNKLTINNYKEKLDTFKRILDETNKNNKELLQKEPNGIDTTYGFLEYLSDKTKFFVSFIPEFDKINEKEQDEIVANCQKLHDPLLDNFKDHVVQNQEKEIEILKFYAKSKEEKDALNFIKDNVKTFDDEYQNSLSNRSFLKVNDVEVKSNEAIKRTEYPPMDSIFEATFDINNPQRVIDNVIPPEKKETYKEIASIKYKFSDETKKAMLAGMKKIESMELVNDTNKFVPEEETKSYAFFKLYDTIVSINNNISKGNIKNIVSDVEQYKQQYGDLQELLEFANKNFLTDGCSYSGNLDVARNRILPPEFRVQEQASSQLSTLLMSVKACKIIGCSLEEFANDPDKVIRLSQDKVLDILGYNESQTVDSMSENIHRILAPKIANSGNITGVLFRGFDGLFSLEKDENNYAHNSYLRSFYNKQIDCLSNQILNIEKSFKESGVETIANMLIFEGKSKGFLEFCNNVAYDYVKHEMVQKFDREAYIKDNNFNYAHTAQRLSKEVNNFLSYRDISDDQKTMFIQGASKAIDSIIKNKTLDKSDPGVSALINLKNTFDTKTFDEIQMEHLNNKEKSNNKIISEEYKSLKAKKAELQGKENAVTGFNKIPFTTAIQDINLKEAFLSKELVSQISSTEQNIIAKNNLTQEELAVCVQLAIVGIANAYSTDSKFKSLKLNQTSYLKQIHSHPENGIKIFDTIITKYHKDLKVPGLVDKPLDQNKESLLHFFSIRYKEKVIDLLETYVSDEKKKQMIEDSKKVSYILNDDIMSHTTQDLSNEIDNIKINVEMNDQEKQALDYVENSIKITDKAYQAQFENISFSKVAYVEVKPREIMEKLPVNQLINEAFPQTLSGDRGMTNNQDMLKEINKISFKLNNGTKKAIKEVSKMIDDMNIITPENMHQAEEGEKVYGFLSLNNSIATIREAVKTSNIKELPSLVENYKSIYEKSMKLIKIAKDNFRTDGISYGANIDVSRNQILPSEIKIEEQAVSQISNILIAKKFCLTNNIDFDAFLDDPSKVIAESAKKLQLENSVNKYVDRESIGNTIYNLTHRPIDLTGVNKIALLMRGYDGLFGLETDEKLYENNIVARSVMTAHYEMAAAANTSIISMFDMTRDETLKNIIIYDEPISDYTKLSGNPTINFSYVTNEMFEPFDRDQYINEHEFNDTLTAQRLSKILDDYSKKATVKELSNLRNLVSESIQKIIDAKSKDGKEFPELMDLNAKIVSAELNEKYKDVEPALLMLDKVTNGSFNIEEWRPEIAKNNNLDELNIDFVKNILNKAKEIGKLDISGINDILYAAQTVFNFESIGHRKHEYSVDGAFVKKLNLSYFDKEIVERNKEFIDNNFKSIDGLMSIDRVSKSISVCQKAIGNDIDLNGILAGINGCESIKELTANAQSFVKEYVQNNINENIENLNNTNVKEIFNSFKDLYLALIDFDTKNKPILGTFEKDVIFKDISLSKIVDDALPSRFEFEKEKIERNIENSNDRGMDRIQFAKDRIEEIFTMNKDNPKNAMIDSVAVLKVLEEKYATRTSTWKFFHPNQTKAEAAALKFITDSIKDQFDITDAEIDGLKMMDKDGILFNESVREKAEPKKNAPKTQQELVESLNKENAKSKEEGMVEKADNKEIGKVKNKENVIE